MKISEFEQALGVKSDSGYKDCEVRISTDTRTIGEGDFYLPLRGANFDGEKFIEQALEKGAVGAFYTKENNFGTKYKDRVFIKVDDCLTSYLKLAKFRRNKVNPTVVAVTGSSGKTTTKELVSAVLSAKYRTFKTPLNHNNEVGFCQTIFEMPDNTEVLVLEMGMRGLGEIELLSKYSEPDITIIANVGTAHIGRLGSRENIAKAKCEIVKYQRGNIFIGHDDELIKKTLNFSGEKNFYSVKDAEIMERSCDFTKFKYDGDIYELNVGGDYNVENAISAIICGKRLNLTTVEIGIGLKNYKSVEKRWELVKAGGYEVVNDSYNANPESMRAFVDTIFRLYKNYALVLGDMGELGEEEVRYHRELGKYINSKTNLNQNSYIISIGGLSKHITDEITACKTAHFETVEDAVKFIRENVLTGTKLFLKASRSMKFERIIDAL